nr:replication restart DNA helicase PriA [Neosynechococcus sphagnicola]
MVNNFKIPTIQVVRCPNCGSVAERHHLTCQHLQRTQCPTCDYLMITCSETGRVIEAYAPGIRACPKLVSS